ncbi:hypothetical protein BDN70DRAFT_556010 [Pholiota conissans]|uniref:Uncharacterized protein n=1 Tax=Pholiota conissans TaxID=109636 RepID=A0A9P5YN43_9AGAR|nr:hypothetical protein BDN70DRAFT_556010 [Pholiota conissans]
MGRDVWKRRALCGGIIVPRVSSLSHKVEVSVVEPQRTRNIALISLYTFSSAVLVMTCMTSHTYSFRPQQCRRIRFRHPASGEYTSPSCFRFSHMQPPRRSNTNHAITFSLGGRVRATTVCMFPLQR